jgi:hypothetical protein
MQSDMSMDSGRTALSKAMRDLWADHVVSTRNYIIAATTDDPAAQAAATRLLANQEQIGQAMVPYYGQDAGHWPRPRSSSSAAGRPPPSWSGRGARSSSPFDQIFDQAMMMADTLTDGIVKQFPDRFRS